MSSRPGTAGRPRLERTLVDSVLMAVAGSLLAVAATMLAPPKLVGAAMVGLIAVVAVRLAPMTILVGLTVVRATLEGLGPSQLLKVGGVAIDPPDVLSLAFLAGASWWLISEGLAGNPFWKDSIALPAVAVALIGIASLAYSPAPTLGARDLLKWSSALCAYVVIVAAKPDVAKLKRLLYGVIGGAVVPLLIGWWQLANDIGKPNLLHGGLRIQSTFNHPNTYGFYAVTVIVAAWGLKSYVSGRTRILVAVVGFNAFAAVLFTLSRTAWAALAVVLLVIAWRDKRVAVLASVGGVAILAVAPRLISRALDLFQPREVGKGNSLLGRLSIWSAEFESFLQRPVLGHGFGYTLSSQEKASHNDYLRMLVETGLVGFAALIALVVTLIRHSWRVARNRSDLPLGFFGLSIAYAVQSLASNNLGKGAYQLYFWVLAGAAMVWATHPAPEEQAAS